VRASRFGDKSFDLDYELRVDGKIVAEAKSVLVGYDYDKGETVTIPDDWRARLAA
jgi:acyl-CoA thioester hydrolase